MRFLMAMKLVFAVSIAFACSATFATAEIPVITTTTDLADSVKVIGGDKVEVTSIARGDQDTHLIEPRPSHVVQMRNAKMFVRIGMDYDLWADAIVDASRNSFIRWGKPGYVDCSVKIKRLEVPKVKLGARMGEWHVYGNPHYWLDPANAEIIANNILEGLIRVSPQDAEYFKKNCQAFVSKLKSALNRWQQKMAPYKGAKIVTYHKSWVYFAKRFGLKIVGEVEPKPGIPPTASHVASLINKIKAQKGKVIIIVEPFYPRKAPDVIAEKTGAEVLVLPNSVGGIKGVNNYIELFDYIIDKLSKAFS